MSGNVIQPIPKWETWKCPECGHKKRILAEGKKLPFDPTDFFLKKKKQICPKCDTEMERKSGLLGLF